MKRSKTEKDSQPPGLERLLNQLKADGIPVGPEEILRLRHAFRLQPLAGRERLFNLLACTLCKSPDQTRILADDFDLWYEDAEIFFEAREDLSASAGENEEPQDEPSKKKSHPVRASDRHPESSRKKSDFVEDAENDSPGIRQKIEQAPAWIYFGILWTLLIGIGIWFFRPQPEFQPLQKEMPTEIEKPVSGTPSEDGFTPSSEYWTWHPVVQVVPDLESGRRLDGLISLTLLTLLAALIAGLRYYARVRKPKAKTGFRAGLAWTPLLPQFGSADLLSPTECAAAAWNIDKFVSEDWTRALDIPRTVRHTCREGGIPMLHYQAARYPREIWLWQDMDAEASSAEKLIAELTDALRKFNLPVRVARFWSTPDSVEWEEGYSEAPLTLEGHRQQVRVFVFTDGAGLDAALGSALDRSAMRQLLQSLAQWPGLQFVDTSKAKFGLGTLLPEYGIECIAPPEVTRSLAGAAIPASRAVPVVSTITGNLSAWAAALCLSTEGANVETALALLNSINLDVPGWQIELLQSDAGNENLIWPTARRAELLNWLSFSEPFAINKNRNRNSTLQRAIDFWRKRYEREIERRGQNEGRALSAWIGTKAYFRIQLEIAFLDLWDQPEQAEKTLNRLRQTFQNEIRERLAVFAPRDFFRGSPPKDAILLPWRSDEIETGALSRLLDLGFAAKSKPGYQKPRMSPAFGFAQGLLWGMIAIGAYQCYEIYNAPPQVLVDDPVFKQATFRDNIIEELIVEPNGVLVGKAPAELIIGTPKRLQHFTAEANQNFQVQWTDGWRKAQNPEPLGRNEVWYAGRLPQPIRACDPDWPRRSLVVIEADPQNSDARKLGAALLDKGSADKVLIGLDWAANLDEFIEIPWQETGSDQLIVIAAEKSENDLGRRFQGSLGWVLAPTNSLKDLERELSFSGIEPANEVWGDIAGFQTDRPDPLTLRGGPEKILAQKGSSLTLIEVCGGTFSMGSESDIPDEKPVHPVVLDTFWVSESEVTNAEYAEYKNDRPLRDDRPATNVNWDEAKKYCEHYEDYRLPTEAEWEYAARGGSLTDWSFGDDEKVLGDYAWFGEGVNGKVHPVKTKKPNPLGIYDMHGNAWEWVEDCFDKNFYGEQPEGKPTLNPVNQSTGCEYRGLRGGSAWDGPRFLRSAFRCWFNPLIRSLAASR